jgi:hypothetical protein
MFKKETKNQPRPSRSSLIGFGVFFNVLPFCIALMLAALKGAIFSKVEIATATYWVAFFVVIGATWWTVPRVFPMICPECLSKSFVSTGLARAVSFKCLACDHKMDAAAIRQYK